MRARISPQEAALGPGQLKCHQLTGLSTTSILCSTEPVAITGPGWCEGCTKGEGTTQMLTAAAVLLETLGVRMQSQHTRSAWEQLSPAGLFLRTCSGSLSTISSDPHPCTLLAPHCCPWIWLNCIPLLRCPTPKCQNVLLPAPCFLPGQ